MTKEKKKIPYDKNFVKTYDYQEVLDFWFEEKHIPLHFVENPAFDKAIHDRFYDVWKQASEGMLAYWRETPHGQLAEIIVLDQFSRNLFREDRRQVDQDKMALVLAQALLERTNLEGFDLLERRFALMPFMHAESKGIHEIAVVLFELFTDSTTLEFENMHKGVIDRLGRYPYQNEIMGRETTPEEQAYIDAHRDGFYRLDEME